MLNVVVRYKTGEVFKGTTANFFPNKPTFHLISLQGGSREIVLSELKAVFFVKSLTGDPSIQEPKEFSGDDTGAGKGRKSKVSFLDGETLIGFCPAYRREMKGFFLFPSNPNSNNDRIYVVADAVRTVELL